MSGYYMFKVKLFFFFFLCANLFAKDTLVFAALPMFNKKITYSNFYPMITSLEKKLNKKILFYYSDNYEDVLKDFKDSKIDLVYLGALPYVQLTQNYSFAQPLVTFKNNENLSTYTCSLVKFIKNEKVQKVALTQALSTCGYLSVNNLLDNKLENYDYKYVGRHDEVALSVIRGEFDLGGIKTSMIKDYYHLGLEEVSRTTNFPAMALIANTETLNQDYINNVKEVLLNIKQEEFSLWGEDIKYGVIEAFDKDYDEIRAMIKDVKIPTKDKYNE